METSVSSALAAARGSNGPRSQQQQQHDSAKTNTLRKQLGVYSSSAGRAGAPRRSSTRRVGRASSSKRQSLKRMTVPDNIFDHASEANPTDIVQQNGKQNDTKHIVKIYSKSHKRHYYYNRTAQRLGWTEEEVQDRKYRSNHKPNNNLGENQQALLHDVEVKFDHAHNRLYYYSRTRQQSVWTLQVLFFPSSKIIKSVY